MKKFLSVILTLALMLTVLPFGLFTIPTAAATSGTTGDCTWTLDGTVLTISGNGKMEDYNFWEYTPWGTSITNVIIEDGVTSIGDLAFYECGNLTSITIGDGVTGIGSYAFEGCASLTSITIPNSVTSIGDYVFKSCSSIISIIIPNSVTSIGYGIFSYCHNLSSIVVDENNIDYHSKNNCLIKTVTDVLISGCRNSIIPNYVTSIGENAFYGCTALTNIIIPNSVTSIGFAAFGDCNGLTSVNIGDSVTSIGDSAFSGCTDLTSVTIPDSVKGIGSHAFEGCTSLTSITIPDSVTSITYDAFYDCISLNTVNITDLAAWCEIDFEDSSANPLYYAKNLYLNGCLVTELVIPEGVTQIKNYAFYSCNNLISVTVPDSVTSIGSYAFEGCDSLTNMTIPDSVTNIGFDAFSGTTWYNNQPDGLIYVGKVAYKYKGSCPSNVVIKEGTVSIGHYAFDECTRLTRVIIPDSVVSIGHGAFFMCENLTSIVIPDSVTSIGDSAFTYCDGLTSITISNSVTSIGNYTFYSCDSLKSVTIPDSVTSIGHDAFKGCTSLTSITIPDSVMSVGGDAFYDTAWYNKQPDGLIYAGKVVYGYKGTCPSNVVIKEGTLNIGENVFNFCETLENITIPDSVTSIGYSAFYKCTGLTSITIPDSVTSIDVDAFYGCTGLTSVTIGNNVKSIGDSAFYSCTGLTNITIPDNVTSIGGSAFANCTGLTSITIPNSVTSIGYSAFSHCDGLKDVYYYGSESERNNISIGSNNSNLSDATWHYLDAHEHVYGEWIVTTPATDAATGSQYKECECGDKITMVIPRKIKFAGASLTLESNVAINYKVKPEYFDTDGYDEIYLVVSFNGEEYTLRDPQYIIDEDRWVFSFKEVSGQMMTDVANATLYGVYQGEVFEGNSAEYSAVAYAKTMLPKSTTTTRVKRLIVDLLNYGTAAQYYTSHNVKNLANAWLSTAQKALGTQTDRTTTTHQNLKYKVISNPTVSWKGAGLKLEAAITVRYTIQADDITDLKAVLQLDGETYEVPSSEFVLVEGTTNRYYIYFDGAAASQMSEPILATIQKGNKAVSNTVQYSIESYIHTNKSTSDAKLSNLLQKMLRYGDSAFSYAYPTGK